MLVCLLARLACLLALALGWNGARSHDFCLTTGVRCAQFSALFLSIFLSCKSETQRPRLAGDEEGAGSRTPRPMRSSPGPMRGAGAHGHGCGAPGRSRALLVQCSRRRGR